MPRERLQFAAGGGIPEFDGSVGGAGGNELAIGRIGHGMNAETVTGLDKYFRARRFRSAGDRAPEHQDTCEEFHHHPKIKYASAGEATDATTRSAARSPDRD